MNHNSTRQMIRILVVSLIFLSGFSDAFSYCPMSYSAGCGTTYIKNVTIVGTTLNNNSNCVPPASTSYPPTGSTTATLQQGASYTISITTSISAVVAFWIDYDRNNSFDFAEWTQVSLATVANTPSTVVVTLPITASIGTTGFRVRSRGANNFISPAEPCTNFFSGDGEDYTITIAGAPACSAPLNAGNTLTTNDSVCSSNFFTLSLSGATIATGLTYQWQASPDNVTWSDIPGATAVTYASNPITNTTYFHCVINCGAVSATSVSVLITAVGTEYYNFLSQLLYREDFDTWISQCDDHEVPSGIGNYPKNYWKNTPDHGDQSWRRQDQGFSTSGWTNINPNFTLQPHAGAGAACFHTYSGTGLSGTMDLYLNCINFSAINLDFYYFKNNYGSQYFDTFSVQISTNGGFTFGPAIATYVNNPGGISPIWQYKVLSGIAVNNSPTVIVRFRDSGDIFQSNDTGLDDVHIDGILGITNPDMDNTTVAVVPNPSNGKVEIRCSNKNFSKSTLRLLDLSGRIIAETQLQNEGARWTQTMDWSKHAKGVYSVQLISEKQLITKKIVIE